ncbi:hypothetical protein HOP50_06g44110 [Chloropicon primus]|uniref:Uncharacterized protein n=1 Tax=Chloropicon primus TaxID=1764295 RepID=A0A5B8MR51_9CHLO|nr:hypothetical protein A3770_06p43880 [Chloropicon primus]UPR01090.1 hypothetical protein HOP50_06g44110 [Chloropicon primus]|eukprot:QDZ21870.1 hypothetical protein A3770_06p43880 [Chloropicon primus]
MVKRGKRSVKQARIKDLKGVVALKKHRTKYTASDFTDYRRSLESQGPGEEKFVLLQELLCIEFTREMVQESEIEAPLTELLFHSDRRVAEAATEVLLQFRQGESRRVVNELRNVPLSLCGRD